MAGLPKWKHCKTKANDTYVWKVNEYEGEVNHESASIYWPHALICKNSLFNIYICVLWENNNNNRWQIPDIFNFAIQNSQSSMLSILKPDYLPEGEVFTLHTSQSSFLPYYDGGGSEWICNKIHIVNHRNYFSIWKLELADKILKIFAINCIL